MYDVDNLKWNSQLKIKALKNRVADLENGKAYNALKKKMDLQHYRYEKSLKEKDSEIDKLRKALIENREMWFKIFLDVQNEFLKRLNDKDKLIMHICSDACSSAAEVEELKKIIRKKTNEVVEARQETLEQKDINQKLIATINQDYTNSSVPSSQSPFRDKVQNNRPKTDKLPGGQPGHEGHKRPHFDNPDEIIFIEDNPEIAADPDYYPVEGENGLIRKQVIGIRIIPYVTEYVSRVYRSRSMGKRYHAPFPEGIVLETSYDESIKSLIFSMRNHLNVSEAKISEFINDFTDGILKPSRGMINHINCEFALKSEEERASIFDKLVRAKALYTDFTNVRHNGKLKNVLVVTDKEDVLYFFRDTKGDAAIEGTPLEYYMNILVHDHAAVFFHYGSAHQDCGAHKIRRAKGVAENEPMLTWSSKMHDLLAVMNDTRSKADGNVLTETQIADFEKKYDEILDLADIEYYDNPPNDYYRKGINLAKELREYKESMLFFLRHPEVDFTNNFSENSLRKIKRHMVVIGTFRGADNTSGEDYCAAMSVLQSIRERGERASEKIGEIFSRAIPSVPQNRDTKGRFIKNTQAQTSSSEKNTDPQSKSA